MAEPGIQPPLDFVWCPACLGAGWDVRGYAELGRDLPDPIDAFPTCPTCQGRKLVPNVGTSDDE